MQDTEMQGTQMQGTLAELIEKAGGPSAVGRMVRAPEQTVKRWLTANSLPPEYHLPLWKIAVVHRVDWTPPACDAFVLRGRTPEPALGD